MVAKEMLNIDGGNFDTLVAKAYEIQTCCTDYIVSNAGQKTFMDRLGNLHFTPDTEQVRAQEIVLPMSDWSMGQLAGKTGLPRRYLERCFVSGRGDLAARNVNSWLGDLHSTLKIRSYAEEGQEQRAIRIVSGRYADYDQPYLLEGIQNVLDTSEWTIKGSFVNEERLHVRLTQREPMKLDGGLFPAIFIDSSDVGRSALRIQFGIYRLACTNGLIIPAICARIHQRHIGVNKDDLLRIVAEAVQNIPAMMDHAQELIHYAVKEKVCTVDPTELQLVIKRLEEQISVSEDEAKQIIRIVHDKYWDNRWGLVNGITEFAQTKELERRLELEEAAGILLAAA